MQQQISTCPPIPSTPLHFDPDESGRFLCREDGSAYLERSHVAPNCAVLWALIREGRYVAGGWRHIDEAIRGAQKYLQEAVV